MKASYVNNWNLPDEIIKKHGLIDEGRTVGASFITESRIFALPEVGDTHLMECDQEGNPLPRLINIFILKGNKRSITPISFEFLEQMYHNDLLNLINEQFSRM